MSRINATRSTKSTRRGFEISLLRRRELVVDDDDVVSSD